VNSSDYGPAAANAYGSPTKRAGSRLCSVILIGAPLAGLAEEQREKLKAYLAQDQVQFLHEAKAYIQQQFNVCYSMGGLHKLFERLKVKKKTGRPTNYRKDEKGAVGFKKILRPLQSPTEHTISSSMKCAPAPARN
jgi:transposase